VAEGAVEVQTERAPSPGRWGELLVLFCGLPVLVALLAPRLGFPVLFAVLAGCVWTLLRDPTFDRRALWRLPERAVFLRVTLRALVLSGAMVGLVALYPVQAFGLVRHQPYVWLLLVAFYPLLSVPPQEMVFRTFFLHRYRALLGSDPARILGSALAFGLAHLCLRNGLAVGLSTVGGLMFASTYLRTRSLPAVLWEHALYGIALFTVGLGRYFVTGWAHPP
jgi:hypothetical protein